MNLQISRSTDQSQLEVTLIWVSFVFTSVAHMGLQWPWLWPPKSIHWSVRVDICTKCKENPSKHCSVIMFTRKEHMNDLDIWPPKSNDIVFKNGPTYTALTDNPFYFLSCWDVHCNLILWSHPLEMTYLLFSTFPYTLRVFTFSEPWKRLTEVKALNWY